MQASRGGILGSVFLASLMAAIPYALSAQVPLFRANEPATPYTAEYRLTHTQRLSDGNLINIESKEVVAVDSQHRTMRSNTETLIPSNPSLGTRVFVTDPVARTNATWTSSGQRATVNTWPEAGALRGCTPNATRRDGLNPGVARSPRPKPVIEDLGTDTVQGIEAHGRRVTTTIPAGELGNEAPMVRTSEVWTAVSPALAHLVVREISDNPQSGHKTKELVSLDQREPDPAAFQPPPGYEIVHMTTSQAVCSTEAFPTPQQ
jgi:hypothetical protein